MHITDLVLQHNHTHIHSRTKTQVFPRVPSRPPRLLQELEALLVDRLRVNDRLASTSMLLAKERDPGMAANLSLDDHRQVCGCVCVRVCARVSMCVCAC